MRTRVEGDPGSCRDAARALRRVAARAEDGGALARRGAGTPEADFSGATADAYRDRCELLVVTTDGLAQGSEDSARALDTYADDLAAVQDVMARVRSSALAHGLLDGDDLRLRASPTPAQERAHDRLVAIAGDATTYLERARARLVDAFTVELSAPVTPDYGTILVPPEEPVVGPISFPPPDSAWPRDGRHGDLPPGPGTDLVSDRGDNPADRPGTDPHPADPTGDDPTDDRDADPGLLTDPPPEVHQEPPRTPAARGGAGWDRLPDGVVLPGEERLP